MIAEKLAHYFPGAEWNLTGETYASLEWFGPGDKPSEADLDALPWPVVKPEDVAAERARRLALGFDYDFGDERGAHRIGTTAQDMAGWDEVTQWSGAMIALGTPAATTAISTDTGAATVSAMEWQDVLAAAAAFRQPIWQASFAIQAMDPIPVNLADDGYWP